MATLAYFYQYINNAYIVDGWVSKKHAYVICEWSLVPIVYKNFFFFFFRVKLSEMLKIYFEVL